MRDKLQTIAYPKVNHFKRKRQYPELNDHSTSGLTRWTVRLAWTETSGHLHLRSAPGVEDHGVGAGVVDVVDVVAADPPTSSSDSRRGATVAMVWGIELGVLWVICGDPRG